MDGPITDTFPVWADNFWHQKLSPRTGFGPRPNFSWQGSKIWICIVVTPAKSEMQPIISVRWPAFPQHQKLPHPVSLASPIPHRGHMQLHGSIIRPEDIIPKKCLFYQLFFASFPILINAQKMGRYIQWTQGPKLACTVHICTVASSLGEYPGPCTFRAWVCVSNHVERAILFF